MRHVFFYVLLALVALHIYALGNWIHINKSILESPLHFNQAERYVVKPGAGLNWVISDLYKKKWMAHPLYTRLYLTLENEDLVLKKGTYEFSGNATPLDILRKMDRGDVYRIPITIPEGLDKWETATLLGNSSWGTEKEFLAIILDPTPIRDIDPKAPDLEGYLFPETYHFSEEETPQGIISAMLKLFREKTVDMAPSQYGWSIRKWVSMASLIEKETAIASERNLISGVFHSRLQKNMLLQCDPTIIYGLKVDNRYRGKIYRSDIKYPSPYNTYVYPGIPPGPIANPSLASLEAALHPSQHEFLYFVAKNDGSHHFSKTLKEHNRAVQKYQR